MTTKQDIIDYFKEDKFGELAMGGYWQVPSYWEPVTAKVVDEYGGEDCGSTYYTVWQFDLNNGTTFYLRFDGWYASHYGCDYQDFREVKPKEVTKIEFV